MHKIIKRDRRYEFPPNRADRIEWEVYLDGKLVKMFPSKREAIDWVMAREYQRG